MTSKEHLQQFLIVFDQLVNTIFGGYADETISARCYRLRVNGHRKYPEWIVNHLFFWQENHCFQAYLSEVERSHLPKSYLTED